jgi:predicted nucleic acid-binding protein
MQLVEDTLWKRLVVTLGTKTTEIEVDLEDQVQEDTLVLFKLKDQQVQETLEVTVRQKEILEEQGDLLETLVAAVEVAQVLSVQTTAEPLEETAVLEL